MYAGWQEALRKLGVEVAGYNLNDRLIFYSTALVTTGEEDETGHPIVRNAMTQDQAFVAARQGLTHALYTFWPDVVLFISAFFMTAPMFALIRQRQHRVVILHTESPYQDDEQLMRGDMADLNLLNDPVNLAKFRELGPAEYMPHAYRPKVHYPRRGRLNPTLASDFVFVGTAFDSRVKFFSEFDFGGADALLAGNDWGKQEATAPFARYVATGVGTEADCVDNTLAAEMYRNSKAGLNLYRREGESTHEADPAVAMGPREVEMAACGLFFLRDSRPEGDELFKGILPTFDGPEDASEQFRWWLFRDGLRDKRAAQAREAVSARTFENNARRLLALIEKL